MWHIGWGARHFLYGNQIVWSINIYFSFDNVIKGTDDKVVHGGGGDESLGRAKEEQRGKIGGTIRMP